MPVARSTSIRTRFVIEAHSPRPGSRCASPVLPPDDVKGKGLLAQDIRQQIGEDRGALIKQMRNGYRAAFERHRRDVIPESGPDGDNGSCRRRRRQGEGGDVQIPHPTKAAAGPHRWSQGRPRRPGRLCGQPRAGAHREGHEGDRQTLQGGWRSVGYGDRGPSSKPPGMLALSVRHTSRGRAKPLTPRGRRPGRAA